MGRVAAAEGVSLLELRDVAVSRRGRTVLEGLSLAVEPGDLLWVRGANGAGKSSLLRVMAGLLRPGAGEVVAERPFSELVGYLGHRSGFDVMERLDALRGFWLGEVELAEVLGEAPARGRRFGELSAGQRRKVELMRLHADGKPLWLLDEPYASLDAGMSEALTGRIVRHLESGGAAVVASHAGLPPFGRPVRVVEIA